MHPRLPKPLGERLSLLQSRSKNDHRSQQITYVLKRLLMVQKSCDHQLRLVAYPSIYKTLSIQGGAGILPSTVSLVEDVMEQKLVDVMLGACILQKGTKTL